ncbi:MAG TPA: DUF47 family protein [Limnochordia bacterium]|nr:DUF47 family protein [Limnochordia bacterium]
MFNLSVRPRNNRFFVLLDEEVENVRTGVAMLVDLFEHYVDLDEKVAQIKAIEHKGDKITRTIMEKLNDTFITPIEREDISAVALTLDEVLDRVHGVAERTVLYKIPEPTENAVALARLLKKSVDELAHVVTELHFLRFDRMDKSFDEIKSLEEQGDKLYRQGVAALLNDESGNPFTAIKWKEIYENFEDALDYCEDVANLIKGVTIKNA